MFRITIGIALMIIASGAEDTVATSTMVIMGSIGIAFALWGSLSDNSSVTRTQ